MGTVYIIGLGPGHTDYLLPIARKKIAEVDFIVGSKRMLETMDRRDGYPMGSIANTIDYIDEKVKLGDVGVLVSGDSLFYSLAKTFQNNEKSKQWEMKLYAGISSLQMLGSVIGITMEDVFITSIHGRGVKEGKIASWISEKKWVFFLCSRLQGPSFLADICLKYGLENVTFYIGSNLSYETETLEIGTPKDICGKEYAELSVVAIENNNPVSFHRTHFLKDSHFVRGKTPMTKEEVRVLAVHNLNLQQDSIVWDIGAGTGSISIECARQCPFGTVYSVEYKEDALELMEKNKEKFQCENMEIVQGKALECILDLPTPDCVFIGGSGRELKGILEELQSRNQKIRVVLAAVTVETLTEGIQLLSEWKELEITQVSISKSRTLGSYHMLEPYNAVHLLMAETM